jgi:hypothetical protein
MSKNSTETSASGPSAQSVSWRTMPGPREEAVLYVLFFIPPWHRLLGGGAAKGHTMLISVSLGRSLLSTTEELLVSSTNCESDPRDLLPRTLADLDQLKYRCVYLLLLHRRRPCRACFSDSLICFGYEYDLIMRVLLKPIISLSLGVRDGRAKIRAHLQLVGRLVCSTEPTWARPLWLSNSILPGGTALLGHSVQRLSPCSVQTLFWQSIPYTTRTIIHRDGISSLPIWVSHGLHALLSSSASASYPGL